MWKAEQSSSPSLSLCVLPSVLCSLFRGGGGPRGAAQEAEAFGGGGDEAADDAVELENSVSGTSAFNYTPVPHSCPLTPLVA